MLAEYDLADQAYYLSKTAAELAKRVAAEFSTPEKPRFVAGSMGPTTKLPTLGHIDFDTMKAAFAEQAKVLYDGGVDLLIVETCQDVLQIKAALSGIEQSLCPERRSPTADGIRNNGSSGYNVGGYRNQCCANNSGNLPKTPIKVRWFMARMRFLTCTS